MLLASGPRTRLSAMALLLGCTNVTLSFAPIEKLCQLSTAFWLACWTMTLPEPVAIVALPAATEPPPGRTDAEACASADEASAIGMARPIVAKAASLASALEPNRARRQRLTLNMV